ncbi:hypothetical protein [Candidatus Vondammii sp. HM_W22]|uniref:hypothetical protein n=1 Tax=Candidatus Vondammii sp. HM_W22 TaxID=2687299 RepID=UPI001F142CC6|nr:hypothetical protein [Candidatus Vondammii sp. HM_W22]
MKAKQPSELIQVDHGFTEGFAVKGLKATCLITGTTIMRAYSRATSHYDFYPFYQGSLTIVGLNKPLAKYQGFYRPHKPMQAAWSWLTGIETEQKTEADIDVIYNEDAGQPRYPLVYWRAITSSTLF